MLITSQERGWAEIAAPVEIDVLARAESVAILRDRVDGLIADDADRLAAELGDLPLAVAQAAGFMAETGMAAIEYLGLLDTRAGQILDRARPVSYPRSLAAATQLSIDRLTHEDPAAAELASLCAFLAPEPIPEDLLTGAAAELSDALAERAAHPLAWRHTLARLTRQVLARIDRRGLQRHGDHRMPETQSVDLDATSGRGLLLVKSLTAEWGAYVPEETGGKVVWAVCARTAQKAAKLAAPIRQDGDRCPKY